MADRSILPDPETARELGRNLRKKVQAAKPKLKEMAQELNESVRKAKANLGREVRRRLSDVKIKGKRTGPLATLEAMRKAGTLDVAGVAKRVGVSPATVMAWTNGTTTPKPANLERLAKALAPRKKRSKSSRKS
jgi:DNA-binding transcriptional regulator YiaG